MKKEILRVPKNMFPLDYISMFGDRTANSWIFIDNSIYEKMVSSHGCIVDTSSCDAEHFHLIWEATEVFPRTEVYGKRPPSPDYGWGEFELIIADDIAFDLWTADPDEIFFLSMVEEG